MLGKFIDALRRDGGLYPLSALALFFAGLLIVVSYWKLISPTPFTIAVAPPQSAEADLIDAFTASLENGRRGVRLIVQREKDLPSAAVQLEQGNVDLAIVRPDVSLPANGLTVAILRQEALIILHPAGQKLAGASALKGRTLALVSRGDADARALDALLAFHDVADSVRVERLDESGVSKVFADSRVAAVAFVATPGSAEVRRITRAAAQALGKPLSLLSLSQGEAFNAWNPAFSAIKIPAGGVLADPVVPAEETDGVAVSWRLMARSGLDRGPISTLTERLFEGRSQLARSSPVALSMRAPDADNATSAVLPNHRGALDYFNREQLTFMDRYGDWLWFGLFAATGVSSAFAWIGRLFTRRRREIIDDALARLCKILSDARNAETLDRLSEISLEVDRLVAISVWRARRRTTNARTISALMLAIDAARAAVRERREEITRDPQTAHGLKPGLGLEPSLALQAVARSESQVKR